MIWRSNPSDPGRLPQLSEIKTRCQGTLVEHLGIEFTEVGPDYLVATMPVAAHTKQPAGILHGGASAAFAETLGSFGSAFVIDPKTELSVGLEINANHIRAVREGVVTGRATALHLGRRTHVWEIRITDKDNRLVCISRLTLAIIARGTV